LDREEGCFSKVLYTATLIEGKNIIPAEAGIQETLDSGSSPE
jgi:hypothetical protein